MANLLKRQRQYSLSVIIHLLILSLSALHSSYLIAETPQKSPHEQAQADIQFIEMALSLYKLDNLQYPTTQQGLAALRSKPIIQPIPVNYLKEGYIHHKLIDPWGNPYIYKRMVVDDKTIYEISTFGQDNRLGGTGDNQDIIVRSNHRKPDHPIK